MDNRAEVRKAADSFNGIVTPVNRIIRQCVDGHALCLRQPHSQAPLSSAGDKGLSATVERLSRSGLNSSIVSELGLGDDGALKTGLHCTIANEFPAHLVPHINAHIRAHGAPVADNCREVNVE